MPDTKKPCLEWTVPSRDELDFLEALPDGAHEINSRLACEYQLGHPGPHHDLGQAYGSPEQERWLRWSGERRDWFDIAEGDHCHAEGPPLFEGIDENEICVLPATHPGAHSFEI